MADGSYPSISSGFEIGVTILSLLSSHLDHSLCWEQLSMKTKTNDPLTKMHMDWIVPISCFSFKMPPSWKKQFHSFLAQLLSFLGLHEPNFIFCNLVMFLYLGIHKIASPSGPTKHIFVHAHGIISQQISMQFWYGDLIIPKGKEPFCQTNHINQME